MMMMMVVVVMDDRLLGWHRLFLRKGRNGEAKRNKGRQGNSKLLHGIPPGSRPGPPNPLVVRIVIVPNEPRVNAREQRTPLVSRAPHQLGELGEFRRHAAGLVLRQAMGRRAGHTI